MTRDVGLDIIVAKMMASEYMAGLADAEMALEIAAFEQRGVIVKGLLRSYAQAVQNNDREAIASTRAALDTVAVSKAMEIFMTASGQQQREVLRDEKGRFSRYLSSAGPTTQRVERYAAGQRKRGNIGVQDTELQTQISTGQNALLPNATDPNYQTAVATRQEAQTRAGKVRAIARFQDELMDVFGDKNEDVVIIVENTPTSAEETPESEEVQLNAGVPTRAVEIAEQPGAKMTLGLRPEAKAESREKYNTLKTLMESGMRPDVAASYVMTDEKGNALPTRHGDILGDLSQYGGKKKDTYQTKAQRHFKTAGTLGSYFASSGQPQLQALGGALTAASKIGGQINPETYEIAERMNFRLRGMKDNLPREFSEMTGTRAYADLAPAFSDPTLSPQKWHGETLPKIMGRVRDERALSTDERTQTVSFSDPTSAVLSHMDRTVSRRVSPRDFMDRFTRDMAITSLIREVPADDRIVQLGAAAGYGVPSSGIIIRSDGQAKEMYRGVADDHYLPFSAKALPELRDGQYVRTRTLGGLTPEDITTSVVSGARRAAVVSGSGVFTIEFKPDTSLVGRLRSPEVAAMGEKYERILNQVSGSGLYARDLSAADKAVIYDQARKFAGTNDPNNANFTNRRKALTDARRAEMSTLTEDEVKSLTEKFTAEAEGAQIGGRSAQQRAQIINDLVKEEIQNARDEKVRAMSLNAEGYALALETLRAQYPSIIRRVSHESLKDFVNEREMSGVFERGEIDVRNRRGAKDTGLVTPGETRAYVKDWDKTGVTKPGGPKTAPAPLPGAGTGATGAAAAPGAQGTTIQALRTTQLKRQVDKAISDTSAANQFRGVLKIDPLRGKTGEKTTFYTVDDFKDALPPAAGGVELGIDVPITGGKFVGAIVTEDRMIEQAVQSQPGLTAVMSLAYGTKNPGDTGWNGIFEIGDDGKDPGVENKEDLAAEVDRQASAYLLRHSEPLSGPLPSSNHLAFYTPPDVLASIPKVIEDGKGQEVFDRVKTMAYDTAAASAPSRNRSQAKDILNNHIRNTPDLLRFNHHADLEAGNAVEQLSILGLLGMQAKIMKDIDNIQFSEANKEESQALLMPFNNEIANDSAAFDDRKKKIKTIYQEVFGTEFALRLMGGGVGPKALAPQVEIVRKSVEEEQLELLLQLVQSDPELQQQLSPPTKVQKAYRAHHLMRL